MHVPICAVPLASAALLLGLAADLPATDRATTAPTITGPHAPADSLAVAQVIDRFHDALAAGDSAAALSLLTDDVIILESGDVETKEEYRAHHLSADIAFARAVPRQAGPMRVTVRGDVAWATSTSIMRGSYRDREINSQSVELMVLERTAAGWRIAAIHWSSRTLRQ
jgi:ketosteroid isomerase-like protein